MKIGQSLFYGEGVDQDVPQAVDFFSRRQRRRDIERLSIGTVSAFGLARAFPGTLIKRQGISRGQPIKDIKRLSISTVSTFCLAGKLGGILDGGGVLEGMSILVIEISDEQP